MNYLELKRKCLEHFFKNTNEKQREAIFRTEGPVLIIAGAGSGKTTVLCNRIANLTLFGNAYHSTESKELTADNTAFLESFAAGEIEINAENTEKLSGILSVGKAMPWSVLAVTFTNKAAKELKERLSRLGAASDVWAGTFHSVCVRILRRGIENIGYKSSFTIYDMDDSLRMIKQVMKELNISDSGINPKIIQSMISRAKDKLIGPNGFSDRAEGGRADFMLDTAKKIYAEYQLRLIKANALDFDDIIMKTVELFDNCPEVLETWQNRIRYIMVDEYQDTNSAQYKLVSLLAAKHGNLCVVGDEDQSIYRFRGATIENILSFEDEFRAFTVKLEQNYRSTQTILNAANAVIKNNTKRKEKTLWSGLGEGEKIELQIFSDEQAETRFIGNTIAESVKNGGKYSDNVILYRTNAQSRTVELEFLRSYIPYKIIGGTRFYDRKEIKDIIAYLSVLENPFDLIRLQRIINVPKRNIGDVTQDEIQRISVGLAISAVEVMERAEEFTVLQKKAKHLTKLAEIFKELIADGERYLPDLIEDVAEQTGYLEMLSKEGEEGEVRTQNIKELKSAAINFCEENPDAGLSDFLEHVSLISDIDGFEADADKVTLMTMHSAKGLEFDTVFLVGGEENIFPSYRSMADPMDLEEERRLAYVAITRAKQKLYVTCAKQRLLYGQTQRNRVSRFIKEIPEQFIKVCDNTLSTAQKNKTRGDKKNAGGSGKPGYLQSQAKYPKINKTPKSVEVFSDGDRVSHNIFGTGTVLNAIPSGGDTLLEIAFDKAGTKKIMANFARINKI